MKRLHRNVVYTVLSVAALAVAGSAPIPWSGSGGGGGSIIDMILYFLRVFG